MFIIFSTDLRLHSIVFFFQAIPYHRLIHCCWEWYLLTCQVHLDFSLFIVFPCRSLHKYLVTKESISSTIYLTCVPIS